MIKLLEIEGLRDGTRRFQSQLLVGRDSADFIIDTDNVMKCYGYGFNGFDFYPYYEPYNIVSNKSDMIIQAI